MSEVIEGIFSIWGNTAHSKYQILSLVQKIPEDQLSKEKILDVLKQAKIDVNLDINTDENNVLLQYRIMQKPDICEQCGKRAVTWSKYCGASVCGECGKHQKLARCFCGWNLSQGEKLPDDIGESQYLGNGEWQVDY